MLAVKFYSTMPSSDENVLKGISGKIPAIVVFNDAIPDETYTLMTDEEYQLYLNSVTPELVQWHEIQNEEVIQ